MAFPCLPWLGSGAIKGNPTESLWPQSGHHALMVPSKSWLLPLCSLLMPLKKTFLPRGGCDLAGPAVFIPAPNVLPSHAPAGSVLTFSHGSELTSFLLTPFRIDPSQFLCFVIHFPTVSHTSAISLLLPPYLPFTANHSTSC